jgi:hypothetical protein
MPQLIPFYFFNQIFVSFLVLLGLVYLLSKYILPINTRKNNKQMRTILKKLLTKSLTIGMAALNVYTYRISMNNDKNNKTLEKILAEISAQKAAAQTKSRNEHPNEHPKNIAESNEKSKDCAVRGRHPESSESPKNASDSNQATPSDSTPAEMDRAKAKLDKSFEEVQNLNQSSFFEYFQSLYTNYTYYIETLNPDKAALLFNIIMGYLSLSYLLSLLTVLLSENIIKRIKFLDRYPSILAILKMKTEINTKITQIYLIQQFLILLVTIIVNTYMFFL